MMLPAGNASWPAQAASVDAHPSSAAIDPSTLVGIIFGVLATAAGALAVVIAWRQLQLTSYMSRTPSLGGSSV
ncbi:hypothetical protein G6O67_008569 [Ophiocordyceps sinensis]|uniref:Uncharacterized protein n=1 Tax=Ophiocordyceps sinensis TaxID=72228 RepID=A0A8H4LRQ1_9HYPO|nr:hypothetical protein G6O67_008569 [Ophiocordyceps sinensis]